MLSAKEHISTASELRALLKLGFRINMPIDQAVNFINTNFSNLNLGELVLVTEYFLGQMDKPAFDLIRVIELKNTLKPELTFSISNYQLSNPLTGLGIERTFTRTAFELIVEHVLFVVPLKKRSQGIARPVFKISLQQYVNMGLNKIKITAGLSDGGYLWAKNFFTADHREEMDVIILKARKLLSIYEFSAIKAIYDAYYGKFPHGMAFPIKQWADLPFMKAVLTDTYWDGTMDLNNPEQFNNFILYTFKS